MGLTPEKLVAELKAAHGRAFGSAFLYGSAAHDGHDHRWSDVNLVVVVERVDAAALAHSARAVRRWEKAGNPAPLLMTPAFLRSSADAYPLEWLDILEHRRVLAGPDPVRGLAVSTRSLRAELERELKSAWLRLLGRLQACADDPKALRELLIRSSSTFLVLFRGCLRLDGRGPLPAKEDAAAALGKRWRFPSAPFAAIAGWRRRGGRPDPAPVVRAYLAALATVVARVDSWKPATGGRR